MVDFGIDHDLASGTVCFNACFSFVMLIDTAWSGLFYKHLLLITDLIFPIKREKSKTIRFNIVLSVIK